MQTNQRWIYRLGQFLIVLLFLWILTISFLGIKNQFRSNYSDLSVSNKTMLREVGAYYKKYKDEQVWAGYDLNKYSFLAVDGRFGEAYLINPSKSIHSFLTKEIAMPSDSEIKVYRIAAMSPVLYKTYGLSIFNGLNENINVYNNKVFYLRYDKDSNIDCGDYNSRHFIVFLAHEAFHNEVQKKWGNEELGGRFSTDSLTDNDKKLLATRYDILQDIQDEMKKKFPSHRVLKEAIKKYIDTSENLKRSNPAYFKDETMEETFEGTATYIGKKAAEAVNYGYNVTSTTDVYGQGVEHISFKEIMPAINSGKMNISSISTDWVYSSGGLWCEVLDELGNNKWQERLNAQTTSLPVTLYDLIKEVVN